MTQPAENSPQSDDTGGHPPCCDYHEKIVQFLKVVLEPGTAVELRAFEVQGEGTVTRLYSTNELDGLARHALDLSGRCRGVYFTLNPVDGCPVSSEGRSVKARDILRRRWLLVDADVQTKGKPPATDAEKEEARLVIERVRGYLRSSGWSEPIVCDSGNGYHLLYRIDLPTDDGRLVRRVLRTLAESADSKKVKIDRTVFDPPRICKLPYTLACKGEDRPGRPYRLARVLVMPAEVQVVTQAQLEALAGPVEQAAPGFDDELLVVPPEHLAEAVKWASNYVKWMKPAIEGKGGDAQTFKVVCTLANDFALPFKAAWPILLKWNARCDPPWDEDDLERKWNYAESTCKGRRGSKIPSARIRRSLRPPAGERDAPLCYPMGESGAG